MVSNINPTITPFVFVLCKVTIDGKPGPEGSVIFGTIGETVSWREARIGRNGGFRFLSIIADASDMVGDPVMLHLVTEDRAYVLDTGRKAQALNAPVWRETFDFSSKG